MRVLITGGSGFLGTELVRQLAKKYEIQVIALTSQEKKLGQIAKYASNITVIGQNAVFEPDFVFSDIDVLINCAFPRNGDGIQMANGLHYINSLMETAVTGGVKSVINISSQSVYSQMRLEEAAEDTELNLESKYAIGKYAVELMTNSLCHAIPHTNIRMASMIGVGFDQRLVNKFVKQVLAGNNLSIKGGKQLFGFLDVRDAASAIITVAEGSNWDEVYNLGSDRSYSLLEIAECVQNTVSKANIQKTQIELVETDDWQNSSVNSARFRKQFGWNERYTLEDTIKWILQ